MANGKTFADGAIAVWKSNLERADKLFAGLDAASLERQVAPDRNRLIYLWGHLAATHDRMLHLLGVAERVHPEFDLVFLGSPDRTQGLPASATLQAWWDEVNMKLEEGLGSFTADDWLQKHAAVSEEDFANEPLRNRFSILITRTNHLAYHLGQAALAPK
jgi:hypothetical protein